MSHNTATFHQAHISPDTCRIACSTFPGCLSWRHDLAADQCALDTAVRLGRELDPPPKGATKTEIVSGWMLERIEKTLLADKCEVVTKPWSPQVV